MIKFFEKTSLRYDDSASAIETLHATLENLMATLETINCLPAYAGAFGIINTDELKQALASISLVKATLENTQVQPSLRLSK